MAYVYKVPLTVQSGQITGTVTGLIGLIDHTFLPWAHQGYGGQLLGFSGGFTADWAIFADEALTIPLDFQQVSWDYTTGKIVCWVKIPSIAVGGSIWVAYRDASNPSTYQGDHAGTWSDFWAVYHMESMTSGYWFDSSLQSRDLTNAGGTINYGKLGENAGEFNGSTQYAQYSSGGLPSTAPITITGWAYQDDTSSGALASIGQATGTITNGWLLYTGTALTFTSWNSGGFDYSATGPSSPPTTTWFHFAGVSANASSRFAYVNGAPGTEHTGTATPSGSTTHLSTGAALILSTQFFPYNGRVDELRVYVGARSHEYIEADYHTQNNPAAFWVLGAEQPTVVLSSPGAVPPLGWLAPSVTIMEGR